MTQTALTHFLAFGPNVWGKGQTEAEAKANLKKAGGNLRDYDVFQCHPETTVDEMGWFHSPLGKKPGEFSPRRIKSTRKGKAQPVK